MTDVNKDLIRPPSWGFKLPDAVESGKYFLWQHAVDANLNAISDERASNNQGSAIADSWLTEAENIQTPSKRHHLYRTILGGWNVAPAGWITPYKHPYYSNYYAKDIVAVHMGGCQGPSAAAGTYGQPIDGTTAYAKQSVARITISFETLPYSIGKPVVLNTGGFNPNYMTTQRVGIDDRINTALGIIVYKNTGFPTSFGSWIIRPQEKVSFTFHYVKAANLFTDSTTYDTCPGPSKYDDYLGKVNYSPVFGYAAETLCFDSYQISKPIRDYAEGYNFFEVVLNMIYLPRGWNNLPTLDGNAWAEIAYKGGAKVFETTDMMGNIFVPINS